MVYPNKSIDRLSATFGALADPTRRKILARLASGERSVTELAEPFDMSLPAVSKHLKVLARASLIERGRDAQWRPCRLRAEPLKDASDWLAGYRQFWEDSFDRLAAHLEEMQRKDSRRPPQDKESRKEPQSNATNRKTHKNDNKTRKPR